MKKIAIVILNWNQPKITLNLISSLKKINTKNIFKYQIILIDNHSDDDSYNIFKQTLSSDNSITLLQTPQNLGYAGGNNYGIKIALKLKFDYILILNNDTIVDPDFLTELLNPLLKNAKIGISVPKIYFAPGFEFHKNKYKKSQIGKIIWSAGGSIDWKNVYGNSIGMDEYDRGQYDQPRDNLEFASGCCWLIPRPVFQKIGLLSPDYFLYYEDDDFCQKVIRSAYLIHYQPSSIVWHLNSGSSKAGGGALHDYFLTRNRLIFGFKYAPHRTKFALFRDSLRTLFFTGTKWQKRGIIDFYLNIKGKGSWR